MKGALTLATSLAHTLPNLGIWLLIYMRPCKSEERACTGGTSRRSQSSMLTLGTVHSPQRSSCPAGIHIPTLQADSLLQFDEKTHRDVGKLAHLCADCLAGGHCTAKRLVESQWASALSRQHLHTLDLPILNLNTAAANRLKFLCPW